MNATSCGDFPMSIKFNPPLDLDLGSNPRRVVFNTTQQVRDWIDVEVSTWGPSGIGGGPVDQAARVVIKPLVEQRNGLQSIRNSLDQVESNSESNADPDPVGAALKKFADGSLLHSKSRLGAVSIDLFANASTPYKAAKALGFLGASTSCALTTAEMFANRGQQADVGAYMAGVALHNSLVEPNGEKLAETFHSHLGERIGEWEQQLALHQNEHFDAVQFIEEKQKEIAAQHSEQKSNYDALTASYEEKYEELKTFYEDGLRAEAPVNYWRTKARTHTRIGVLMTILFVFGAVAAAFYGYNVGSEFNDSIRILAESGAIGGGTPITGDADEPKFEPLSFTGIMFSKFLVLLVPGFFAVWFMRIVLKIALTNLGLADDARHRVTMVETFLSLMQHSDHVDDADRILMLQALFKPIPGSNDEEATPPNWFDVMMQQVNKNK